MFCYLIFLWTYQGFYLSSAEQPSPKSIIDRGRRVAGHRTSCVLLQSGTHWPPCDDLDTRPRCLEATCPLVFTLLYSAGLILVIYHVVGIYPKVCLGERGLSCKAETDGGGVGGGWGHRRSNMSWSKNTVLFFFLFNKRKCGAVSFLSAWCQTGVFSAPLQRLSLNTWEATSVLRVALLLTVWNVWLCVRACACLCVRTQGL